MRRGIFLSLLILFFVFSASAFADELKLVKGKGVPVCEAHYKNLKSLTLNEMVCERDETYPEENGITRPRWERLELKGKKELVKKIRKFFYYGDQLAKVKTYDDAAEFEDYLSSDLMSNVIKASTVDIANNGKQERVMLYSDHTCNIPENIAWNRGPYSRPLFVLDEAKDVIDIKKTEPLLQNISKSGYDIKTKAIEHLYRLYDVFFYKKDTYFDKWNMYDWTLTVYKLSKDRGSEVCRYKYKTNYQK
ncbi:MAG: hypothetical protein M1610_01490 [Nitrospirae bacterium]|nr:hypothetical protein [Nitrospirota bacterium]MDA8338468.1 hypothetical protein [Nitrospiraceae bacterium]